MISINNKKECTGCHACYNICPTQCISMEYDEEGFLYPNIDLKKCVNCNRCVQVCPELNVTQKSEFKDTVYASYSKSYNIRYNSSSGGVFTHLAEYIIENGGIVFGAAFDEEYQVHHVEVNSIQELNLLRGSKYVQSRIEETYKHAKRALEKSRMVLFSGTPCQIDGLRLFLGRDYENLYTQDIICHGVPAPFVWGKYLKNQEEKKNRKITNINFRDKENGWNKYSLTIYFDKYDKESSIFTRNPMMRAYLRDMCLRPSCYECPSKGIKRSSDITLADFWNVQDYFPDLNDNKGINLVICHSLKGMMLLDAIKDKVECKKGNLSMINNNLPLIQSPNRPTKREEFINNVLENMDFEVAVNKYCSIPLYERIVTKIKILKKRIFSL